MYYLFVFRCQLLFAFMLTGSWVLLSYLINGNDIENPRLCRYTTGGRTVILNNLLNLVVAMDHVCHFACHSVTWLLYVQHVCMFTGVIFKRRDVNYMLLVALIIQKLRNKITSLCCSLYICNFYMFCIV